MKKLIVLLAIVLLATPALSAEKASCEDISKVCGQIMDVRQLGMSASVIVKAAPDFKGIILKAYDTPMYSTEKYKAEAVQKFSNKCYVECEKNRK